MLWDVLSRDFLTIFLIVGFSMKLVMRQKAREAHIRYLWMTTACVAALVAVDNLELLCASDPAYRFGRILFSVLGYGLRPAAGLGVALVVSENKKQRLWLCVPAAVNLLLVCTAFFSPIVFSFNEEYVFQRGPLGFVPFVVGFLYIAAVLASTWKWFEEGREWEGRVLMVCALFTFLAALVDSLGGSRQLNAATMVSVIFYYMFIRTRDTNRDSLTKLLNRQSFYEDYEGYQPHVTAVASIDMNGLKRLNDRFGHVAGDQALAAIGQSLLEASGRNVVSYRMGGDEFAVLFLRQKEEDVTAALEKIRASVEEKGHSVSVGCAFRREKEDINTLYQLSDQQMYEDKAAFYRRPGHNRRTRRR